MSRADSSRFPVTVTRLPLTRCEVCGRTLAYQPGQASAVLTKHYLRMHPDALSHRWAAARGPSAVSFQHLRHHRPARGGGVRGAGGCCYGVGGVCSFGGTGPVEPGDHAGE